jgi:two-component system cell cycle sensor histidine kinase/response regulator CckA
MNHAAPRVLLVDDEPPLLKMMSIYLRRLGYDVATTDTKSAALEVLNSAGHGFSVAVVDATMEGVSVQELALELLDRDPALRFIAASGYPVDMTALEAAAPGRVLFLHKPFVPEMLADAVRRMIAGPQEEDV